MRATEQPRRFVAQSAGRRSMRWQALDLESITKSNTLEKKNRQESCDMRPSYFFLEQSYKVIVVLR